MMIVEISERKDNHFFCKNENKEAWIIQISRILILFRSIWIIHARKM